MGIKGLNPLIKRHALDAFFTMPMSKLSGKRVAIDASGWMHANMSTARKNVINRTDIAREEPSMTDIRREWFLSVISFIINWLSHGVTPVFVFDGRPPPEKSATLAERRTKMTTLRTEIDAIYVQLRTPTPDIVETGSLVDTLRKKLRNYIYISPEDRELFKMIIRGIGVPCLQAVGEAEQLCAMLCIEGKAAAVFSVDTDNLAYGAPLIITKLSKSSSYDDDGNRVSNLDCTRLDRALVGLNLTHSKFVDLCIMSGCDNNTNMPGYAAIKSYGLLLKHGSIDDLPRQFNTTCLNHIRCRDLFRYVPSTSITLEREEDDDAPDPDLNDEEEDADTTPDPRFRFLETLSAPSPQPDLDLSALPTSSSPSPHTAPNSDLTLSPLDVNRAALINVREYLEMVGVGGQIERLMQIYNHLVPSTDGYIPDLHLGPIPRYIPPPPRITLQIGQPRTSHPLPQPTPLQDPFTILGLQKPPPQPQPRTLTLNIMSPSSCTLTPSATATTIHRLQQYLNDMEPNSTADPD